MHTQTLDSAESPESAAPASIELDKQQRRKRRNKLELFTNLLQEAVTLSGELKLKNSPVGESLLIAVTEFQIMVDSGFVASGKNKLNTGNRVNLKEKVSANLSDDWKQEVEVMNVGGNGFVTVRNARSETMLLRRRDLNLR